MSITATPFGVTKDGLPVTLFRLQTPSGAFAEVLDYGATLRSMWVYDRENNRKDVCLGYDDLRTYEERDACLGALVGRVANRIGGGRFSMGGKEYTLAVNNGPNHLHGGVRGFDRYRWDHKIEGDTLVLSRTSPDGEEGYPGAVYAEVRYTFTPENALVLDLIARADAETPVNLTSHVYWNLDGQGEADVGGHTLQIAADAVVEIDGTSCPTGRLLPVEGTPFDLRRPKTLATGWEADHPQIKAGGGYDHNFALDGQGLRAAAVLRGERSGIALTLSTTQPGLQVYTANFLSPRVGKEGARYGRRCAVALEAQGFPDAVNHPNFPSVLVRPGEDYRQKIVFAFSENP